MDIGRSGFFEILKKYRQNPDTFSLDYSRGSINRKISGEVEDNILTELYIDKCMIEDKSNPIKYYNYSYIKDLLLSKYGHKVSLLNDNRQGQKIRVL
jgi:hypothetical protein